MVALMNCFCSSDEVHTEEEKKALVPRGARRTNSLLFQIGARFGYCISIACYGTVFAIIFV